MLIWSQRAFLCAIEPLLYEHLKYKTTFPSVHPLAGLATEGLLYMLSPMLENTVAELLLVILLTLRLK